MPEPKTLHSGQYWQDVRRCSKMAKEANEARAARTAMPGILDSSHGSHVFTFVPGRSQPYTSMLDSSGKLLPISGPSKPRSAEETQVARLAAQQKRLRAWTARTRQLQQESEAADAALLALLKGGERKRQAQDSVPSNASKKRKLGESSL
ncbi:hypothetical protein B0H14DRAFT_3462722 [Mycena olivaceomarginata]|nr:hypothetical protein B0H14DRAFT_3462722 [Mycena olivaceomarginata]